MMSDGSSQNSAGLWYDRAGPDNVPLTEPYDSTDSPAHLILDDVSKLYSVLWQLSRPEVRAAFLGGYLNVVHNTSETLASLDVIR